MPQELGREELQELIKKARDLLEFQQVMADEPVVLILGHEPVLDLGITLGIQVALEEFTQKERPAVFKCSVCGGIKSDKYGRCVQCRENYDKELEARAATEVQDKDGNWMQLEEPDQVDPTVKKKYDRENDEVPSGTYRQNPDGTWSEAEPLEYAGHLDFECWTYDKYYAWEAYDGDIILGEGIARTKLGRWWQMFQFKHFMGEVGIR